MIRDDCEPHFKVLIRVQVVCFCSLYKTVDHCAGFCPMVGLDQNKALLPDRKGADGPLGRVVVHRDVTIGKELPEILLLVDSVAEGISNRPEVFQMEYPVRSRASDVRLRDRRYSRIWRIYTFCFPSYALLIRQAAGLDSSHSRFSR